jgi:hypothetical protein
MNPTYRIILKLFIPVFLLGGLLSCEQETLDSPPLNELEGTLTVSELRALYQGQPVHFSSDLAVYATVTMGEASGNIYRNIFVQDETAALNVRMDFAGQVREGDLVRIGLKGTVLTSYNNMLQLDSVEFGRNLIRQGEVTPVEPRVVTIPEILAGGLQAEVVMLEGVQFASGELGKRFANIADGITENRNLIDCDNNRIIVRTSPFANFANEYIPDGNGSLVAVVSQFGTTWQLFIRSQEEISMDGERCDVGDPAGYGTFDEPYNVAFGLAYPIGSNVWVEGFIVGVMETSVEPFAPYFGPPFQTVSNIIIADKADETSLENALIVQLPVGAVRTALNLVNNPENLGRKIKIRGDLGTYFGRPGLLRASGYWMGGQGIVPQTAFWEETFSNDLGSFTSHNLFGNQDWVHATWDGGCAYMSGYSGGNRANENWLVSPAISLQGRSNVNLHLREAINFITGYNDLQVLVSDNYQGGSPASSGDWTLLGGFNRPPGSNWTFTDSGAISLAAFDGQTIHVAFRYQSTTAGASAWQISSVRLTSDE